MLWYWLLRATKISTESLFLSIKWILYLFILILCKSDLVGFFFFVKGSSHYWNGRATSFISNCCQRLFDPWKFIKESFFRIFLYSTIHLKVFQTYLLVMTFTTIALGPYGFVISKNRSMNDALYFFCISWFLFSFHTLPSTWKFYVLSYYNIIIFIIRLLKHFLSQALGLIFNL